MTRSKNVHWDTPLTSESQRRNSGIPRGVFSKRMRFLVLISEPMVGKSKSVFGFKSRQNTLQLKKCVFFGFVYKIGIDLHLDLNMTGFVHH